MTSLPEDSINPEKFENWLKFHAQINEWRRIVRVDEETILVSKFKEDFSHALHTSISQIPDLLELNVIKMQYQNSAIISKDIQRTKNWYNAITAFVDSYQNKLKMDTNRIAEIQAGIDSVYSILETILWTNPKVMDIYKPHEGEIIAYKEILKSMEDNPGIFSKYYGNYEDHKVVNYCPGATIAKTMLTQAWEVCTTTSLK
jgi:hypothetical protein